MGNLPRFDEVSPDEYWAARVYARVSDEDVPRAWTALYRANIGGSRVSEVTRECLEELVTHVFAFARETQFVADPVGSEMFLALPVFAQNGKPPTLPEHDSHGKLRIAIPKAIQSVPGIELASVLGFQRSNGVFALPLSGIKALRLARSVKQYRSSVAKGRRHKRSLLDL